MMDAVKFLKEKNRMCLTYKVCDGCPLHESSMCPDEGENTETIVKAVEKWSAEHPVKTRLQDFLEKHPNAILDRSGIPIANPYICGYCAEDDDAYACPHCEHHNKTLDFCWNLPLEE